MQTWAKRGVRTVLITGGMLAVGTGVASAAETGPVRPAASGGEPVLPPKIDGLDGGTPRHSAPTFAGELFPEEVGSAEEGEDLGFPSPGQDTARHRAPEARTWTYTSGYPLLSGTLDLVADFLPAVENESTREIPALQEQNWISPDCSAHHPLSLELAGWGVDTRDLPETGAEHGTVRSSGMFGLLPLEEPAGRHAKPSCATPSEGFHRSLSWAGPLDDAASTFVDGSGENVHKGASPWHFDHVTGLVVPSEDPAVVEDFGQGSGLVALWESAQGQYVVKPDGMSSVGTEFAFSPEAGSDAASEPEVGAAQLAVLSPGSVDLTSGRLVKPQTSWHAVPPTLLDYALRATLGIPPAKPNVVPLSIPGEHQEKVDEIPDLSGLEPIELAEAMKSAGVPNPGVHLSLLKGEQASVLENSVGVPGASETSKAAESAADPLRPQLTEVTLPVIPSFRDGPLSSDVEVSTLGKLAAVLPEREQAAWNPFPLAASRADATEYVSLPVLDAEVSDFTAMQEETPPSIAPLWNISRMSGISPEPHGSPDPAMNALDNTHPLPRVTAHDI